MAVNQKAVKVLNKVLEAGFTDEKAISAMTMMIFSLCRLSRLRTLPLSTTCKRALKRTRSFPFLAVLPMNKKDRITKTE